MKLLKRLKCWWLGHDPEPPGFGDGCQRCGLSYLSYAKFVEGGAAYRISSWIHDHTSRPVRRWWMKERRDYCGKKLNKGDHSRCIPF